MSSDIPPHFLPNYSTEIRDDTLFHYTSAAGLIGILQTGKLWCTASYCTNDQSELSVGEEVLTSIFSNATQELIAADDPMVSIFGSRGVDIYEYASGYKGLVISLLFNKMTAYISCFCTPTAKEDFYNGLLSQWRAYGEDGGYAIQFSKRELESEIQKLDKEKSSGYSLKELFYSKENVLKKEFLSHSNTFKAAYLVHLRELSKPISFETKYVENPLRNFNAEALESLINYLVYTKNKHFNEERETRLSFLGISSSETDTTEAKFFNRNGLIVPYRETTDRLQLLDCVQGVIVGPNPRMHARIRSVRQLIFGTGKKIPVRPSHIPFTRS